jgi:polyphenol oxidase
MNQHQISTTPAIFAQFPNLIAAESTRHSGISPAPFASLNLGLNTADTPENVAENRRRFFANLGPGYDESRVASSHQVHGTEILVATEPGRFSGYDALITNKPGLLLAISIADCVPILIYDAGNQAVAAIHAGWRGTVGQIVSKTLLAMQTTFGTQPRHCYGYVGTCIDATSFEVGADVAEQFGEAFKRKALTGDKWFVDLKAANVQQLTNFGVPEIQIGVSPFSTVLNNGDYFSHRYEHGQTGRMLAVVGLRTTD